MKSKRYSRTLAVLLSNADGKLFLPADQNPDVNQYGSSDTGIT